MQIMINGEQKIFVWCDFSPEMNQTIAHGLILAAILKREVCLFHTVEQNSANELTLAESKLRDIAGRIARSTPNIQLHIFAAKDPLQSLLSDFAEEYDCILLVAHKNARSRILPSLEYSGFPFLFISSRNNIESLYRQIVVPVGYMKRSKDLALWASFLGRHNGAKVQIYTAEESAVDSDEVRRNVLSIERLYTKFSFPFEEVKSHSPTWKLQKSALQYSLGLKHGLLIIGASSNTNFIDSLLGLTEKKVIEKSGELSVLCINSKRDFYTVCG